MNPQNPYQNPAVPQPPVINPLAVMQPGEKVICEIRRHPIGMLGTYVMSGSLLIVVAVVAFIVAPNIITSTSRAEVLGFGALLFFVVALLSLGFVFIANKVYWGNRWVLTSDSLTQITQTSLLDRQSSQLSLGNLEDVTAVEDGLLAHMFHYGVLRVETAGERSKFVFLYCPNPNYYAQQVLGARELFEQGHRAENPQALYRGEGDYSQSAQTQTAPMPAPQNPAYPQVNPMPPSYGYGNDGSGAGQDPSNQQYPPLS